jgi:hypothetical protein
MNTNGFVVLNKYPAFDFDTICFGTELVAFILDLIHQQLQQGTACMSATICTAHSMPICHTHQL